MLHLDYKSGKFPLREICDRIRLWLTCRYKKYDKPNMQWLRRNYWMESCLLSGIFCRVFMFMLVFTQQWSWRIMAKITKLYTKDAATNPDNVLEQAVGAYESVIIIGYDKDGNFNARASTNIKSSDILWMLETFKMKLLRGDYSDWHPNHWQAFHFSICY